MTRTRRRISVVVLIIFELVSPVDCFFQAIRNVQCSKRSRCNESSANVEWLPRNIYDDLDLLRQSIAKDQAGDRIREIERRRLLNTFAANRRPLFHDLRLFVLLPFFCAQILGGMSLRINDVARIHQVLRGVFRVEFWVVVVIAPAALLLQGARKSPSTSHGQRSKDPVVPKRAASLYSTLIRLDPPEDAQIHETIETLLELWVSAVVGSGVLAAWFAASQTGQTYTRLWPCLRFVSRLGAIASLHQYPKLLYELRNLARPLNEPECQLQQLSNRMLPLALVGLTLDLTDILMCPLSRFVLLSLFLTVIAMSDLQGMVAASDTRTFQDIVLGMATKAVTWFACVVSVRLLCQTLLSKLKMQSIWGLAPILVSVTAPLVHLIALSRLVRIRYTHNLSLANKDSTFILQDPATLQQRMKWRYRLEWRQPIMRLRMAVFAFADNFVYRIFFAGGVQAKILELSRRQIQRSTKDLEENVRQLDKLDPMDSTRWKQDAMDNLAREHQRDYDNESYKDPLGVAIQQTFGIGLGFADGHMEPLPTDSDPSPRRLQARAAKSAILRLQEIYDTAMKIDLDSITNYNERERVKIELRRREEAEKLYLARQMTELIPLEDDGDYDDPAAQIVLPKKSIRKMYRALLQGVSEYDESIDPASSIPWGVKSI